MTPNKKQTINIVRQICYFFGLLISSNFLMNYQCLAQESHKLNEIEINKTINFEDEDNLDFPSNPLEIVDRLRRANSMNDATNPSDAIDEALKSFDMIK